MISKKDKENLLKIVEAGMEQEREMAKKLPKPLTKTEKFVTKNAHLVHRTDGISN